jgi:3-hydroxybutyryl-CoA dehydrogenase
LTFFLGGVRFTDLAWMTLPFLVYLGLGILRAPETGKVRLLAVRTVEKTRREQGKISITVNEAPGFAVNSILVPMINEAIFCLQEGIASAEDIDKGMMLGANHPIGPLALADLIGLDTLLMVQDNLFKELGDSKYRPCPLLRKMAPSPILSGGCSG